MNMEISIVPVSQDANTAKYMAEVVKIVEASGLDYKCTAMSVQVSGTKDENMEVARLSHEKIMSMTDRAHIKLRMDETSGQTNGFQSQLKAIDEILGKEVKK